MANEWRAGAVCNRTAGLFAGKSASFYATQNFKRLFGVQAGGKTLRLSILVGNFPSVQRELMSYQVKHKKHTVKILTAIDGLASPIPGKSRDEDTVTSSLEFWIASEIIVAKSE